MNPNWTFTGLILVQHLTILPSFVLLYAHNINHFANPFTFACNQYLLYQLLNPNLEHFIFIYLLTSNLIKLFVNRTYFLPFRFCFKFHPIFKKQNKYVLSYNCKGFIVCITEPSSDFYPKNYHILFFTCFILSY